MSGEKDTLNVGDVLSDLSTMSAEDIKNQVESVKDDSSELKVPTEPYIKFHTADLLFNMKLFLSMSQSLQDILSRACLFEVTKSDVNVKPDLKASMSDGVFSGSVHIPFEEVKDAFPIQFILDYESLMKVARFAGKYIYVVYDKNAFYIDFYGGRVHLPSYNLSPALISSRVNVDMAKGREVDVPVTNFLRFISIAESFLMSNEVPNLAFMFLMSDGSYLSNGYTVLKSDLTFPVNCSLRKLDLPFMLAACQISLKHGIKIILLDNKMVVASPAVSMVLPLVNEQFPSSYISHVKNFPIEASYGVDFSKFYMMLSVLSKIYRSSGIVALKSSENSLVLESKSLDDKISHMVLSKSTKPVNNSEISFSVEGLLAVLKSLKQYDYLNLAIHGNSFCLFNESVSLVVFGAASSVKADIRKMKKASKE